MDVRDVLRGPVATTATVPPGDPVFAGLDVELVAPVAVEGRLQATGDGEYFWRGTLSGRARQRCRRCLADVEVPVAAEVDVLFSADPTAADDPGVYPLAPHAARIDLGPAVREELALAVPAYALCREACAGLCPACGADRNAGPCACAAPGISG